MTDLESTAPFGAPTWGLMHGSIEIPIGSDTWLTARPNPALTEQPTFWPKRVSDQLVEGKQPTLSEFALAFPEFANAAFSDRVINFLGAGTIEAHADGGDMMFNLVRHSKSGETPESIHAELLKLGALLQAAVRGS